MRKNGRYCAYATAPPGLSEPGQTMSLQRLN